MVVPNNLFGAAASFLYAVSALFSGGQNSGAMQKMLVQNVDGRPSQFIHRNSQYTFNRNVPSTNVFPSASAISMNSSSIYAVQ